MVHFEPAIRKRIDPSWDNTHLIFIQTQIFNRICISEYVFNLLQ